MRWSMRIFGGLNILAALFGLYYFAWGISIHLGKWPGNPSQKDWIVFLAISAVSTLLAIYQIYLGARLIGQDRKALKQMIFVFAIEIAIELAGFYVTWIFKPPESIPENVLWFWSIAIFPLDPQVIFGYAFLGIFAAIIMILVGRRSSKSFAATAG